MGSVNWASSPAQFNTAVRAPLEATSGGMRTVAVASWSVTSTAQETVQLTPLANISKTVSDERYC